METRDGPPRFDLEERTFQFAKQIRHFIKQLPRTICNEVDVRQLARSSGSIGANYLEANGSLGQKDFRYRLRISRKEAKETRYWLRLVDTRGDLALETERERLAQECQELIHIVGAILRKSES
ncbi:MAG TPA: four helix bundle protein [Planctomicrobium sp.]|nr:four helix bundle protein [Planctomicrobium sp.]